jgi:hypothetical protein
MPEKDVDLIRFPIGPYNALPYSPELKKVWLEDIRNFPGELRKLIEGLSAEQLKTPYRPGGWMLLQIVHHISDANLNGYIRCKFAYTESEPIVKPFLQDEWVKTPETIYTPVDVSLDLLEALHKRWYGFLSLLSEQDWQRTVIHPDYSEPRSLWWLLGLYSWHPRHHLEQIRLFRKKMNW